MVSIFISALFGVAAVQASRSLVSRQGITTLTTARVNVFTPYTYFAKAAYCTPSATLSWSCGVACNANGDFKPVASGGDGDDIQYWYVGYDPSLSTVIVAHQGTDPSKISSLLTDLDFFLGSLDSSLFPGIPSNIEVHSGFRDQQSKAASDILASVQGALSQYETTSVTIVGHSLGAAVSLLDSVYLPLHLPKTTTFETILYGLPRVGNKAFADYVDANLHVTHINNKKDPVPILPFTFLGFVHPMGEVHIRENGDWVICPGQDNPSTECIVGDVPNILDGTLSDHDGPYNGILTPCSA